MAESSGTNLWKWRDALASAAGPLSSSTRHVLLTLSLHMNSRGTHAFPSQELLSVRTAMSVRAVGKHLRLAEREGWLAIRKQGRPGQGWARNHYSAAVPEDVALEHQGWRRRANPKELLDQHPSSPIPGARRTRELIHGVLNSRSTHSTAFGPEGYHAEGKEPERTRSGTSCQKAPNHVPTNPRSNASNNNSSEGRAVSGFAEAEFVKDEAHNKDVARKIARLIAAGFADDQISKLLGQFRVTVPMAQTQRMQVAMGSTVDRE